MIPHRDVAQHPLSKPEREEILPVGDLCRFIIGGTVNEIIDGLWQTSLRLHLQLIDGKCRDHEPLLCFYPGPASRVHLCYNRRRSVFRRDNKRHAVKLGADRSEEHTSELQSLMRISYAVFCLKKKKRLDLTIHTQYTNNEIQ